MSTPFSVLIVDGHSVIHAWEDLRRLHLQGAKRYMARDLLLQRVRTLQDMTNQRVVVVFDGTQRQLNQETEVDGLQIFYSDSGHTADAIIERLVAKYAQQYQLRVVTADRMIWETTRSFGALWMSPEELELNYKSADQQIQKTLKKFKRK